jgi:hypothetical protein
MAIAILVQWNPGASVIRRSVSKRHLPDVLVTRETLAYASLAGTLEFT